MAWSVMEPCTVLSEGKCSETGTLGRGPAAYAAISAKVRTEAGGNREPVARIVTPVETGTLLEAAAPPAVRRDRRGEPFYIHGSLYRRLPCEPLRSRISASHPCTSQHAFLSLFAILSPFTVVVNSVCALNAICNEIVIASCIVNGYNDCRLQ